MLNQSFRNVIFSFNSFPSHILKFTSYPQISSTGGIKNTLKFLWELWNCSLIFFDELYTFGTSGLTEKPDLLSK